MYKYGVKLQTLWQLKKNYEEKLIHSEFHAALQIVTLFRIIFETLIDSDLFGNTDYLSLQSFPSILNLLQTHKTTGGNQGYSITGPISILQSIFKINWC